jgi:radical SAM superfamily enzyme YgiQ (UPF0313 family)
MKILMIYPETPSTFWSFTNALKIINKKAAEPPLGLITVAGMLPKDWEIKLIDMNVSKLRNKDILWANYVFISGMSVHLVSFKEVLRKCNILGVKVVAGGPLCTTQHKDFLGVDHFILNEAEITLPQFIEDLKNGVPKHVYSSEEFPDVSLAPVPRWDLLERQKYSAMSIQYSRGCPYDCEFCSITMLNGRKPRTKSKEQFLGELNVLFELGWRGGVSVVDDNFIGNKRKLKNEILPALIEWSEERKHPFMFITEVSINLADDDELMEMMVKAGFNSIFVGIETPNPSSLVECGKAQNLKRDLVNSVSLMHKKGLMVSGGFIVGFDNDTPAIFDEQIDFIKNSAIVNAMVGVLNAPRGTKLFKRLKSEKRLLDEFSGNNMDGSINFVPNMNYSELMKGYSKILSTIYSPRDFYERVKKFLTEYQLPEWNKKIISWDEVMAFVRLIFKIGLADKGKRHFWKFLFHSLIKYPQKFSLAMTMAVYGYHFRRVIQSV